MTTIPFMFTTTVEAGEFTGQLEVDEEKVQEYIKLLQAGTKMPPVVIASYDEFNFIIDGHHRLYVAKKLGIPFRAIACIGEEYEDFCNEVGSYEGDHLIIEKANEYIKKFFSK